MIGRKESDAGTASALGRLKDVSIDRAVIWMETSTTALMALSIGMSGWEQAWTDMLNIAFIVALIAIFIAGLGLFMLNNLKMGRNAAGMVAMILIGCLMVSYSVLIYESGETNRQIFTLTLVPGTILALAGIGMLVVRGRLATRLPGYYTLWLFGILMMLFMPLHELGAIDYSPRDILIGFLGFGISLIGAASFVAERRMALRVETWVTAGDAKYIAGKYDDAIEYYESALYIEPKNAKVWANTGSTFLRMGLWTKALDGFDKALKIDPGLAVAHSGKGLTLTYLKRYSEALESHDKAIKADNSPVSWNNRGNTLARMGAPMEEAVTCYRKALEIDESYDVAWFNKGKAELGNDDVRDAIVSFTRAVELNPQSSDAWFQRGRALTMLGTRDQEALYCFDTAIELKPGNAEAWTERKILLASMKVRKARPIPLVNLPSTGIVFGPAARGQPLLEATDKPMPSAEMLLVDGSAKLRDDAIRLAATGNYTDAIAALDNRLAEAPKDVVTHMTRGVLLSRIGKFEDALASFETAIELKPDWVGPMFSRGMILAAKGDYDGAYQSLDTVTEKRPNYADAWSVKGIILGTQKNYLKAIECFDRAIEIDTNNEDAWRSKSTALNKLGRYDEAIECYERLAALSPGIEENRRFLQEERWKLEDAKTLFRQGVDLAKSRLYEEGLLLLKSAIELRPNYVDALYISGVIYGVQGRYPDAMEHFERVLDLRHEHLEALYGKANILLKQGSYQESLETLERVLQISPEHVDAWCDRGVALAKLGKQTDAMACYDRALKIAGDHPQAIAHRERCVRMMKQTLGSDGEK